MAKFPKSQLNRLLANENRMAISSSVYQRLAQTNAPFLAISDVEGAETWTAICSDSDREEMIKWIISAGKEFELGISIIGLSAAIFDRVICLTKVKTLYVHLFLRLIFHFNPFEISIWHFFTFGPFPVFKGSQRGSNPLSSQNFASSSLLLLIISYKYKRSGILGWVILFAGIESESNLRPLCLNKCPKFGSTRARSPVIQIEGRLESIKAKIGPKIGPQKLSGQPADNVNIE